MDLNKALRKAELKARTRELEAQKVLTDEEMELANELQEKAQARGMVLVPERKVKNKVKFVQMIQENIDYLRQIKYLTSEEKVFLFDIQPYIGLHSNCIVDDIKKKSPIPLTQTELARVLGTSKTKVSRVVNSLVKKGIIAKAESGVEGNNARSYALFLNPNIMFVGDKDNVNETLKAMFHKPMIKIKEMRNLPEKLF